MSEPAWWAEGLLFENCTCTAVCPGHVHFSQPCTHEVCKGFWAVRFTGGRVDGEDLTGIDVVIVYHAPQVMIEGNWRQVTIVSDTASEAQAAAIDKLICGDFGGPWETLARFVSDRLPTRRAPVHIESEDRTKRVTVTGILESVVEAIRGRDKTEPVLFHNIFNQVHDSTQVIARGTSRYDDGAIEIETKDSHGLWSDFRWAASS